MTEESDQELSSQLRDWLAYAHVAYSGALALFARRDRPGLWFPAALLGHHALELFLKTALLRAGHRVAGDDVWGHDLVELAGKLRKTIPSFPNLESELRVFNACFKQLRYPDGRRLLDGLGQAEATLLERLVGIVQPFATATGAVDGP